MGTDVLEFIYLVCFFLGLGFAVLSALLSGLFSGDAGAHMGGHMDSGGLHGHGHDAGAHSDDGTVHYSPLSPVTIAMFISTFGGTGILYKRYFDPQIWIHVPMAAVSALIVAGIVSWIFYRIMLATQSTSQPRAEEAIGMEAEVTVSIPHQGLGEIAYTLRGTRLTSSAKTADNKELPARAMVKIVKQVGNTYIVEKA
jgi:membrane protein implicated in regulation of membrane protease activity